jgi:8-oxo-dGTP pyrophosphatase MutT (NUDIX family)
LVRQTVRQQVAAVCYHTGTRGIEFLLVRTRGGRWIFPKGGVEAGLTQAQSAALEAFEEAGVHGRIEEMPFARYRLAKVAREKEKSSRRKSIRNQQKESRDAGRVADGETVTAHLCEVSHLEAPQEVYRAPTWFSAEKAKRRLLENRDGELGGELASVVDRAVARIRRLEASAGKEFQSDALRKVRFEASEDMYSQSVGNAAALVRRLLIESRRLRQSSVLEIEAAPLISRRKKNYVQ